MPPQSQPVLPNKGTPSRQPSGNRAVIVIKRLIPCQKCAGFGYMERVYNRNLTMLQHCTECNGQGGKLERSTAFMPINPRILAKKHTVFVYLEGRGWWCELTKFIYDSTYVAYWYGSEND